MRIKEKSEKAGLEFNIQKKNPKQKNKQKKEFNIQKTKIRASVPITSWQIDGEQWKQ